MTRKKIRATTMTTTTPKTGELETADDVRKTIVYTYDTTGSASDVYVSGNYAYVADGESGLQIIDISSCL